MVQFTLKKILFVIFFVFISTFVHGTSYFFRCPIPDGCRVERIYEGEKKTEYDSIFCDIYNNEFEFKFNDNEPNVTFKNCNAYFFEKNLLFPSIILRWASSNELAIFEPKLNLTNLYRYFYLFFSSGTLKLINSKGFDVNMLDNYFFNNRLNIPIVDLINCRFDFYHKRSKFQSCQDIESNVTRIQSIFQILAMSDKQKQTSVNIENFEYKQNICPLFFINASFDALELVYLEKTFYKNSMLTFSNEINNRELNSFINKLSLRKMQNINLDLNLLHPKYLKIFQK